MLLRIFNDTTPLVNETGKKRDAAEISTPAIPATEALSESTAPVEDLALKSENAQLGQDEQEYMESRETWGKADGEEDRFNTTV